VRPSIRWVVLVATAVGIVVLFIVLRPEPVAEDGSPTPTSTVGPSPTSSPSPTVSPEPSPEPEPASIEVTVRGGNVVAPNRPNVEQGEEVLIVVRADVSDHVHVHGYDLMADVAPGEPARIRFKARVAGLFEVELEDAGRLLFQLEVAP
jgi:heme/copper-type cytochrome/quinol oxidase subunit 2